MSLRGMLAAPWRSEEHTSELQSRRDLVCRLLLEKKKNRVLARVDERHAKVMGDIGNAGEVRVVAAPLAGERDVERLVYFFFFNDTATTEIYTLSLHDALPI